MPSPADVLQAGLLVGAVYAVGYVFYRLEIAEKKALPFTDQQVKHGRRTMVSGEYQRKVKQSRWLYRLRVMLVCGERKRRETGR